MTHRRIEKSTEVSFLSTLDEKQLNVGTSVIKKRSLKPVAIIMYGKLNCPNCNSPIKHCHLFLTLAKIKSFHFYDTCLNVITNYKGLGALKNVCAHTDGDMDTKV